MLHNAKEVRGYKVFDPDWTCRGFQFEVGKIFTENVTPVYDNKGFHFCIKATDCFNYYSFNPDNKVAEVEALGDIDTNNDDSKCSTNKIYIIREISWQEMLNIVNHEKACNSSNHNSGDWNSGDLNSGNFNSGNHNSGDFNSGNWNSGDWDSGNHNSGDWNSGNWNSGNFNSGHRNSGDWNSSNRNSGNCNSGNNNSGDFNSGNRNSGNFNSGNFNSGNFNSGNSNSGDRNSGDWNKACFSNGCFNTESPKIFMFNKLSDWTYQDWFTSDARYILMDCPSNVLAWVLGDDMTSKEKAQHPEYSITGGFLKLTEKEEERQMWWDGLSDKQKSIVMQLPNFNKNIFKEITGIDVDM